MNNRPFLFDVLAAISTSAEKKRRRRNSYQRQVKKLMEGDHTILGWSLSSFACSYSVSMFRAEHRKLVRCEMSKSDERDMASIAKR